MASSRRSEMYCFVCPYRHKSMCPFVYYHFQFDTEGECPVHSPMDMGNPDIHRGPIALASHLLEKHREAFGKSTLGRGVNMCTTPIPRQLLLPMNLVGVVLQDVADPMDHYRRISCGVLCNCDRRVDPVSGASLIPAPEDTSSNNPQLVSIRKRVLNAQRQQDNLEFELDDELDDEDDEDDDYEPEVSDEEVKVSQVNERDLNTQQLIDDLDDSSVAPMSDLDEDEEDEEEAKASQVRLERATNGTQEESSRSAPSSVSLKLTGLRPPTNFARLMRELPPPTSVLGHRDRDETNQSDKRAKTTAVVDLSNVDDDDDDDKTRSPLPVRDINHCGCTYQGEAHDECAMGQFRPRPSHFEDKLSPTIARPLSRSRSRSRSSSSSRRNRPPLTLVRSPTVLPKINTVVDNLSQAIPVLEPATQEPEITVVPETPPPSSPAKDSRSPVTPHKTGTSSSFYRVLAATPMDPIPAARTLFPVAEE